MPLPPWRPIHSCETASWENAAAAHSSRSRSLTVSPCRHRWLEACLRSVERSTANSDSQRPVPRSRAHHREVGCDRECHRYSAACGIVHTSLHLDEVFSRVRHLPPHHRFPPWPLLRAPLDWANLPVTEATSAAAQTARKIVLDQILTLVHIDENSTCSRLVGNPAGIVYSFAMHYNEV